MNLWSSEDFYICTKIVWYEKIKLFENNEISRVQRSFFIRNQYSSKKCENFEKK